MRRRRVGLRRPQWRPVCDFDGFLADEDRLITCYWFLECSSSGPAPLAASLLSPIDLTRPRPMLFNTQHSAMTSTAPWIVLLTIVGWFWAPSAVEACLMADRLKIVMPHLTDEEAEKMAHGTHARFHYDVATRGGTNCVGGMIGSEFPCSNVDLLGHLSLANLGGGEGADIWGWTDPDTGREYALFGRDTGTSFVDVTDPVNPVYLGNLPSASVQIRLWRDVKTYQNYAYIVADRAVGTGLQIFDLHSLRAENLCATLPCTFSTVGHYTDFDSAHNMVINEDSGFGYVVGAYLQAANPGTTCAGGLHMVDLVNSSGVLYNEPVFKGCFAADGYTHDAQCVTYMGPDRDHFGKEICIASNEDTVTIVDMNVTGPDTVGLPSQLSRTGYVNSAYTHQGWLTEDHRYFIFDDEGDEGGASSPITKTLVMDLTDLDNPVFEGTFLAAGNSIDHNQYVLGNHTYQANYERGLRVLKLNDLENPTSMTEVAFFDSYPSSDSTNFRGAWSVYPYFPSGNVILSDINRGLFVLRVNLPVETGIFADGFESGDATAWVQLDPVVNTTGSN